MSGWGTVGYRRPDSPDDYVTLPVVGVTYRIAVPATPPDRLVRPVWAADRWAGAVYGWEAGWRDDSPAAYHRISACAAETLLGRIWAEVVEDGIPEDPPPLHADNAVCDCAAPFFSKTLSVHFIDGWPVLTGVFLYETAHASATYHPTLSACSDDHADRGKCMHGDIFRCTAEFFARAVSQHRHDGRSRPLF